MGMHRRALLLIGIAILAWVSAAPAAIAGTGGSPHPHPSPRAFQRWVRVRVENRTGKVLVVQPGWLIYNADERRRTWLQTYAKHDVRPNTTVDLTQKWSTLWVGVEGCRSFDFVNPLIGFPYFSYGTIHHTGFSQYVSFGVERTVHFRENTNYSFTPFGHSFTIYRDIDSPDYKNFRLLVKSC